MIYDTIYLTAIG